MNEHEFERRWKILVEDLTDVIDELAKSEEWEDKYDMESHISHQLEHLIKSEVKHYIRKPSFST